MKSKQQPHGLKINRRVGDAVMVGEMRITIVEMHGGVVTLNFEGPRDVPIHRVPRADTAESSGSIPDQSA